MATVPMPMPQGNDAPLVSTEGQQPAPSFGTDEPNVSEEDQAEYDEFVKTASDIIHGGDKAEVMPEILESLRSGKDDGQGALPPAPDPTAPPPDQSQQDPNAPPQGDAPKSNAPILALANTAVQIVQKMDVDSSEAGKPWTDDVLYQGATEVIEMLGDIALAANIYDYTDEEMTGAFYQAVDMYRPIAIEMGRTSDETLKGQFSEIEDADKAGRLGDMLPGAGPQTVGEPPVGPADQQQ